MISATTTSTWVLAPRAMVKAPATGQRSIRAESCITMGATQAVRPARSGLHHPLPRRARLGRRGGGTIGVRDPRIQHRRDLVAPAAAVEDAVVADRFGHVIF